MIAVIKDDVRSWDSEVGVEGDSALPGRSAHDEVAWRHLLMEQAVLRGKSVGELLWDVAKFFDSLDVPLLIQRAEKLDFPIDQLVLGMQVHRAPRVLKADGCFGEPVEATGVSVLAGCSLSTSLSRAFLRDEVQMSSRERSNGAQATHTVNQHIDDVSQLVIGDSDSAVVAKCRREGIRLSAAFTRSKLLVSTKSVVVASSKSLAARIAAALAHDGQPIKATSAAEDLGVSTACGARRAIGANKKRLARGLARSRRVRILASANAKATKLHQTGVRPQQSYGASIQGVAPSQIATMRRSAVLCAAPA